MASKGKKLSNAEQEIINNVINFVQHNNEELSHHYLTVKNEDGQNKKNDIYETISLDKFHSELLEVSVVVTTANYFEREILNYNVYQKNNQKIKQLNDGLQIFHDKYIVKAYIMEVGKNKVLHLHAPETGSNTPCGSTDLVRYIENCKFINPTCIISFGICYGVDYRNYNLGDTLIASRIYPWSIGIKINDDGWKVKCDEYIIDLKGMDGILYDKIQDCVDSMEKKYSRQKIKLANMLTGEAVVSNEKAKIAAIQNSYTCQIIGGEMEGYGLAKECMFYIHIPCVILKAICDWGAVKNIDEYIPKTHLIIKDHIKDQIQAFSAYCAFTCLYELFKNEVFKSQNIVSTVYQSLHMAYYNDGFIRKDVFENSIEKSLKEAFTKYQHMSGEDRQIVKTYIEEILENNYFQKTCSANGITGYIFYGHYQ